MALTQISTDGIKNGTITGSDLATNVDLVDDQKLRFGNSNDLQIFHSNSNSTILNNTGSLRLQDDLFIVLEKLNGDNMLRCDGGAGVNLYYNGSLKLETKSNGINVTGRIFCDGAAANNRGLIFNDNVKISLGSSNDLEIFHDGSNSRIKDIGTGSLKVSGSVVDIENSDTTKTMARFVGGGAALLYYDNSKKFETTSTGVTVTGNIFPSANDSHALGGSSARWQELNISDVIDISDNGKIRIGDSDDLQIYHDGTTNYLRTENGSINIIKSNTENIAKFIPDGAVELYHDNSKKLDTNSGGVKIHGNLDVDDNNRLRVGTSSDLQIYHDGTHSYLVNNTGNLRIRNNGTLKTAQFEVDQVDFNDSANTEVVVRINSDGLRLPQDNDKIQLGASNDLQIFHDGTENFLNANSNVIIKTQNGENMAKFLVNGAVELYHDNLVRLETNTVGITVTSEGNTPIVQFEGASNNAVGKIDCDQVSPTQSHMRFYTEDNGSLGERIRLKHNNAIMINTTSNPTSNAEGYVNMIVDQGRDGFNIRHNHNGNCVNLWRANGDGGLINFYRGNSSQTAVGNISVNSSSTSYNSGSDYRLKENVTPISDGITRLKTLKPSRFNFIADAETTVDGFLAHEVTAVPEAITGTKDEVDSKGNPVYQCIDQSKLVPLLVAAVQELIAKVEVLEAG